MGRSLQIQEDLGFQATMWRVQRVGWAVLGLLVVAAVLGAFGRGVLSGAVTGDPDGVRVEYERFPHRGSPTSVRVRVAGAAVAGDEARVWLSRGWLESMRVEQISPSPSAEGIVPGRIVLTIPVRPGTDEVAVSLRLRPDDAGPAHGEAGVVGGPSVRFSQFVYP
jgi:hypothetical protein